MKWLVMNCLSSRRNASQIEKLTKADHRRNMTESTRRKKREMDECTEDGLDTMTQEIDEGMDSASRLVLGFEAVAGEELGAGVGKMHWIFDSSRRRDNLGILHSSLERDLLPKAQV